MKRFGKTISSKPRLIGMVQLVSVKAIKAFPDIVNGFFEYNLGDRNFPNERLNLSIEGISLGPVFPKLFSIYIY